MLKRIRDVIAEAAHPPWDAALEADRLDALDQGFSPLAFLKSRDAERDTHEEVAEPNEFGDILTLMRDKRVRDAIRWELSRLEEGGRWPNLLESVTKAVTPVGFTGLAGELRVKYQLLEEDWRTVRTLAKGEGITDQDLLKKREAFYWGKVRPGGARVFRFLRKLVHFDPVEGDQRYWLHGSQANNRFTYPSWEWEKDQDRYTKQWESYIRDKNKLLERVFDENIGPEHPDDLRRELNEPSKLLNNFPSFSTPFFGEVFIRSSAGPEAIAAVEELQGETAEELPDYPEVLSKSMRLLKVMKADVPGWEGKVFPGPMYLPWGLWAGWLWAPKDEQDMMANRFVVTARKDATIRRQEIVGILRGVHELLRTPGTFPSARLITDKTVFWRLGDVWVQMWEASRNIGRLPEYTKADDPSVITLIRPLLTRGWGITDGHFDGAINDLPAVSFRVSGDPIKCSLDATIRRLQQFRPLGPLTDDQGKPRFGIEPVFEDGAMVELRVRTWLVRTPGLKVSPSPVKFSVVWVKRGVVTFDIERESSTYDGQEDSVEFIEVRLV